MCLSNRGLKSFSQFLFLTTFPAILVLAQIETLLSNVRFQRTECDKEKILKTLKHIILIYMKTRYKILLILRSLWILVFCNRHNLFSQQVRMHKAKINLEDKGNKRKTTNKTSPKESLTVRDIFSIFDLPNAINVKHYSYDHAYY